MRYYFFTFGCKVNICDTASMKALLNRSGYTAAPDAGTADIIFFNSCTVTASGDNRLCTAIRKTRKAYPNAVLVLTGCYAQAYPEKTAAISEADLILGTKDRARLPKLLEEYFHTHAHRQNVITYNGKELFEFLPYDSMPDNTRAFLKIQDGCNCFCSYCIIPYARGRCRSLSLEKIRESVLRFIKNGYCEIVLCGINLGFYGMEWGGSLADAVETVAEIPNVQRIRLGSLEPERLTQSQLQRLARIPEFCPQFHISLQSGCDNTLKRMKRKYDSQEYALICERIRQFFPNCAITTDFMVGFPGESDADFEESLAFARNCRFASMHVFRYSPRPGTCAADLPDKVPEAVKTKRMELAQAVAKNEKERFLRTQVGKVVPVLFEREHDDKFHIGHAPNGTIIRISSKNTKKSLRNTIFYVKIEESDANCCYGSPVHIDANS